MSLPFYIIGINGSESDKSGTLRVIFKAGWQGKEEQVQQLGRHHVTFSPLSLAAFSQTPTSEPPTLSLESFSTFVAGFICFCNQLNKK